MKEALIMLNELVDEGVIGPYAIGGAVGAAFYTEAFNTEDLDVFAVFTQSTGLLLSVSAIHAAAKARGAIERGPYLVVGNWPIQVLPPTNALVEEALSHAIATTFDGVPTRVMTAEHLCAIALDTGRPKDYARVSMFIEQSAVDIEKLREILQRYNLLDKVKKVENWPIQK